MSKVGIVSEKARSVCRHHEAKCCVTYGRVSIEKTHSCHYIAACIG
jgi:hypothetical protein